MRTKTSIGLLLAAIATVVGAVAYSTLDAFRADTPLPLYRVERSPFARTVSAEGNLEAETTTPIIAPTDSRQPQMVAWLMADGSRVREGDVVIRFDPSEMERTLLDGKDERATAENRIEKRTAERAASSQNLQRLEDVADLELTYAREFQSKDPEIFSRSEIIESTIDEDLATRRLEHARETRDVREDLSGVELDLLELERKKADLKIEVARAGLSSMEVRAPHDGIFVLKRSWRGETQVGQTVWPGQPLAEIPRLDVMQAKTYVLEADAGGLVPGIKAEVVLEAHPSVRYEATVKSVATLATRRDQRSPVQYFEAILELERTDPERMKPGQRVRAVLSFDAMDDVISVPREAVFEQANGDRIVYRKTADGFEPVEIEPGAANLGRVVVNRGLEVGDEIALADPTRRAEEPKNTSDRKSKAGVAE